MKRKSPTPLDEAQFMRSSSVSDQPPVAAIPKTKGVNPLNFSRLPSNELERRSTSPIVRSPGLTTNRSGEIVQSVTFSRTGNMNSLPRNKSNDYLIQQAGTISSQSQRSLDNRQESSRPTLSSQSQRSLDNRQEEGRLGNVMESDAGASTQAATLDRSWRTKEADLTKNLPTVGGAFSFDLERDAQVFLDYINTLEENSTISRRLNITPVFEGNQMTVCRGTTRQESSSKGNAKVQSVTDNVLGFEGKHVPPEICTTENPGCSTNSYPDQKVHPELHPVSVISPTVDSPTVLEEFEKASQLFEKGASGFHRADATPGGSQGVAYGFNEVDQSEACSQKFTTEADETHRHSPSRQGLLNYTSQSCGAGKGSVQFYHQAEALFRVAGAPVGHVGVSAQRGYASDSEDPLDWLEQQKAKLKMRRGRENPTTSTPVDPMFLQELKLRQRTLGRTPVDEKESAKYLVSTGGVQNSKIPIQCPDREYRNTDREYRNRNPTPSLNTGWSDSRSLTRSYDPGIDGRKGTPKFDLYLGGQFAKEIRSPLDGNRSLTLSRCANEIPLSSCQSYSLTACYPNRYSTTDTKTESVREIYNGNGHIDGGTQTEPFDQQEVHETCIAKKIIHQHRGYSPTRLDALVAASVAVGCQSTPSSSRSTERSDSGYTTASVSSTDVELPLTRPEQNILKSNVQTFSRVQTNQPGFEFNMTRPEMRYQVTTLASSSKTNESFNPHSRPTTVSKQLQSAGTVNEQTKFPVTYSQPFYETSQQRSASVEPATPLGDSRNFLNLSISKTLEEQIEELLAFGAQLELKQKIEPQPAENQQSIYDQRGPSSEVHEPFVYANTVKGLSDIPYQNPTYFTEEEKQMLRVTGTYAPTSMDSQILNRQPINSDVLAGQPIRTAADTSNPTSNLDQRVSHQPRKYHDSQGQPIRTTDIRIPTEAEIFNQLSVETCLPNGELVEPANQTIKSQTRTFSQNLYQPSAFPNHKWYVQVSEPANNHTFSNQVTRHDQSQYMGQKSPANQQLVGEWNGIGYWNSEKDTSKYVTVAEVEQTQIEKPVNGNGLPNHLERFRQELQTQKRHGSESEVGFQRSLASLSETEPLQYQQQRFGATRVEKVSSGTQQEQDRSQNEVVQRIPFFSHSDSVFERPPNAVLSSTPCSMNQFAAPLRGDVYRTSSLSSSVTSQSSPSLSADRSSGGSASSNRDGTNVSPQCSLQCVRESYKEWYKPDMAREDVVNFLKYKPPGSFVIRNSTSYAGDFALAVKVSEIPAQIQHKTGPADNLEELVRHFLIESKPSGIRLKGRSNEPVFASLTSFVYQHALTPLSLPNKLLLPTNTDTISLGSGTGSLSRSSTSQSTSRARDEISSTLIYIGTVDLETLTGPEALGKAVSQVEAQNAPPVTTTVVHFMLSAQGIVLTDTKRKLFFRRHYPLNCILYCGTDRGERRWTRDVDGSKKNTERRIFGFICRKRSSTSTGSLKFPDGNECHLLADYETGYPADSVVQLINSTLRENGYNVLK